MPDYTTNFNLEKSSANEYFDINIQNKNMDTIDTEIARKANSIQDGRMSKEDKQKLDAIEEGATNYQHPSAHPASMITEDSNHRFVTDIQIEKWDTQTADLTGDIGRYQSDFGFDIDNFINIDGDKNNISIGKNNINEVDFVRSFTGFTENPSGILFSNDGLRMYILDGGADLIRQFALTVPYDTTTAVAGNTFSTTGSGGTNPIGMLFNNDGSKFYIVDDSIDKICQYDLSDNFNLDTAIYNNVSLSVNGQDGDMRHIAFNNDGTKMFAVGDVGNSVYEYTTTTPYIISSYSYSGISKNVLSQDQQPRVIHFNSDGTKMFITGVNTDKIYQYSLPTAFSIQNVLYEGVLFDPSSQQTIVLGTFITEEYVFISGANPKAVHTYKFKNLQGKATKILSGENAQEYGNLRVIASNINSNNNANVNILPEFDISNVTYDNVSFNVSSQDGSPVSIKFNNTGTKLYVLGLTNDTIYQYSLSTPYILSTASYDNVSFTVAQDGSPTSFNFNSDGTKLYVLGDANNFIYQYTLSTAFDLNNVVYDNVNLSVTLQEGSPQGMEFNEDGTKLYVIGFGSNDIHQYTLSTAFVINTASYDNVSFDVSSQDTSPRDILFNSDGTKLLLTGTTDFIYQYSLSTPYDISTMSYDDIKFNVGSQQTNTLALASNNGFSKLYVTGTSPANIFQYTNIGSEASLVTQTLENGTNLIDLSSIDIEKYPKIRTVFNLLRNSVSDNSPILANPSWTLLEEKKIYEEVLFDNYFDKITANYTIDGIDRINFKKYIIEFDLLRLNSNVNAILEMTINDSTQSTAYTFIYIHSSGVSQDNSNKIFLGGSLGIPRADTEEYQSSRGVIEIDLDKNYGKFELANIRNNYLAIGYFTYNQNEKINKIIIKPSSSSFKIGTHFKVKGVNRNE